MRSGCLPDRAVHGVVMLLLLLAGGAAVPAPAESACPACDGHQRWVDENAERCGYAGNVLPSICAANPECTRTVAECAERREALQACLQECNMPPAPPPAVTGACSECAVYDDWFETNGAGCMYQGSRLGSICAIDPVCLAWVEACRTAQARKNACLGSCEDAPAIVEPPPGSYACAIVDETGAATTPGPQGALFPTVRCPDCEEVFRVGERLIAERAPGLEYYADIARVRDEVIRARVYTLTIRSEHGAPLRARLETRNEDLATFLTAKTVILKGMSILSLKVPFVSYAADRASDISDQLLEHPNEELPVADAVAKLEFLHAERDRLIADLDGLMEMVYCERVLPQELTLNSLFRQGLADGACPNPGRTVRLRWDLQEAGRIRWVDVPGLARPGLGPRAPGEHPQFDEWESLLHRASACADVEVPVQAAALPAP